MEKPVAELPTVGLDTNSHSDDIKKIAAKSNEIGNRLNKMEKKVDDAEKREKQHEFRLGGLASLPYARTTKDGLLRFIRENLMIDEDDFRDSDLLSATRERARDGRLSYFIGRTSCAETLTTILRGGRQLRGDPRRSVTPLRLVHSTIYLFKPH